MSNTIQSPAVLGLGFPLQIVKFGAITGLDEGDFDLNGNPFLVKNDTKVEIYEGVNEGVDITLEVIPAGSTDTEWVEIIFEYGWNPMLVKAIKATANTCNLIWGV